MPLEKSPMGDNCAAERIVVEHEPDLHGGQCEHRGSQQGARNRLREGERPPTRGLAGDPGLNEERNVYHGKCCNDNRQSPFEHESHAAHGKMQHARAPKMQTAHPSIGNEKQIDLEARSEKVLKREGQRVDDA